MNISKPKQQFDYQFKLLILGDQAVGKTTFLLRLGGEENMQKLEKTISTLGVDVQSINLQIDKFMCKLNIWDTAGQERFRTLTKSYFQKADGIILCYSISQRQTFTGIVDWMKQIRDSLEKKQIPMILVGTKSDLQQKRQVELNEGLLLAKNYKIKHFETSSFLGYNIIDSMQYMGQQLIAQKIVEESLLEEKKKHLNDKINNNQQQQEEIDQEEQQQEKDEKQKFKIKSEINVKQRSQIDKSCACN